MLPGHSFRNICNLKKAYKGKQGVCFQIYISNITICGPLLVSRSPLNEDVFTPPQGCEGRITTPDVVQLSEQIHRLLVQPVHSGGSQGYSSLGSSGSRGSRRSHQQHLSASAASSSDSNGPAMDEAAAVVALHKPVSQSIDWLHRHMSFSPSSCYIILRFHLAHCQIFS